MSRPAKLKLVDELNAAFEDLVAEKERNKYGTYMRSINEAIINNPPKNRKQLREIVKQQTVDTSVATKMFTVLNGVENLLLNEPNRKSNKLLKPLEVVMNAYSVRSPKSFATAIYDMTAGRNNSEREKRFKPALLSYYDGFTENIESIEKQTQRALQRTELEVASGIFKDLEDLREQRVSVNETKKILIDKYNDPKRVVRALNTELHEQAERTKLEQSKFMGFTHKRWNAKDGHRPTRFHNQVKGKIVPIDNPFRAAGEEADFPGDIGLPVGERINCRCYVTYHNSPDTKINTRPIIAPPKRPTVVAPVIIPPTPTRPTPTLPARARTTFTPASTVQEALVKKFSVVKETDIQSSFSNGNPEVVLNSLNNFLEFHERYPVFKKYPIVIKQTLRSQVKYGQYSHWNIGLTPPNETNILNMSSVYFNKNRTVEQIATQYQKDVDIQYHPPVDKGKETVAVFEHEFGHHVQIKVLTEEHFRNQDTTKLLGWNAKDEFQKLDRLVQDLESNRNLYKQDKTIQNKFNLNNSLKETKEASEIIGKKSSEYYYKLVLEEYKKQFPTRSLTTGEIDEKLTEQSMRREISRYGQTNDKEFFAETWAEWRLNTENPSNVAKVFGKVIGGVLDEL